MDEKTLMLTKAPDIIRVLRDGAGRLVLVDAGGGQHVVECRHDAFTRGEQLVLRTIVAPPPLNW